MTGWNLPPGCNVGDLPGNTRAEREAEALMERIYECMNETNIDDTTQDKVAERLFKLISDVYGEGYSQAQNDEALAREYGKEKEMTVEALLDGWTRVTGTIVGWVVYHNELSEDVHNDAREVELDTAVVWDGERVWLRWLGNDYDDVTIAGDPDEGPKIGDVIRFDTCDFEQKQYANITK